MMRDLSLYLVTDPTLCGARGVIQTVQQAVEGGARIVQLRDKNADDAETVEQLLGLDRVIDGRALLVVNDRLDAAVEARRRGARIDGVHLGQGDADVLRARDLLGPDALIGLTANTFEHLETVHALPAGTVDYLGVGVIRPTTTKPNHPPALGVEGFRALAASTGLPCVAIGGVELGDVRALRTAGAAGVAVVSALCAADDPALAARAFRAQWQTPLVPRVLSVAGSDPSGGAGIQADLKSIAANGGYGMAAITALTAQNTQGVWDVHVPPAEFLRAQLDAIHADIVIDAVKVGMVANAEVMAVICAWLAEAKPAVVVVDPVMLSTSGSRLLDAEGEQALQALLSRADLITPNLAELAALTGVTALTTWTDAVAAGMQLSADTGARVLVKGGHLPGPETPDALVHAATGAIAHYRGERIDSDSTHGTGCSLASAVATRYAAGESWEHAVGSARGWLREAIRAGDALDIGQGSGPVDHFVGLRDAAAAATNRAVEAEAAAWWHSIATQREEIARLPFVTGLADGSLESGTFRRYTAQDAVYLQQYADHLRQASRTAATQEEGAFWARSARNTIAAERAMHADLLGGNPGGEGIAVTGATSQYLSHLGAVAATGEHSALIAALLPCFWLYSDLGKRLASRSEVEDSHPYAAWIRTYADPAFSESTRRAVRFVMERAVLAGPASRERMRRAFRESARHELAFFRDNGAVALESR